MTPIFCLSKFSQTSALKEYRTFVFRNCIEKFRQKVPENSLIILSKESTVTKNETKIKYIQHCPGKNVVYCVLKGKTKNGK